MEGCEINNIPSFFFFYKKKSSGCDPPPCDPTWVTSSFFFKKKKRKKKIELRVNLKFYKFFKSKTVISPILLFDLIPNSNKGLILQNIKNLMY